MHVLKKALFDRDLQLVFGVATRSDDGDNLISIRGKRAAPFGRPGIDIDARQYRSLDINAALDIFGGGAGQIDREDGVVLDRLELYLGLLPCLRAKGVGRACRTFHAAADRGARLAGGEVDRRERIGVGGIFRVLRFFGREPRSR